MTHKTIRQCVGEGVSRYSDVSPFSSYQLKLYVMPVVDARISLFIIRYRGLGWLLGWDDLNYISLYTNFLT